MMSFRKLKQFSIRSVLVLAAFAIGALAVVPLAPAHTDRQTAAGATTIQVRGGEFFFRLSSKTAKPGQATFVFKNIGHVSHDFKINGKQTPLISPGKTAKLVVTLKKGRYPYLCTVPGHAAAGMKGVVTVR
jgi:plastocyanin